MPGRWAALPKNMATSVRLSRGAEKNLSGFMAIPVKSWDAGLIVKKRIIARSTIMAKEEKPVCTVDPVCNMDLEAQHGKFMYGFEDEIYYFCSELCKGEFIKQPEKFVKKKKS